MVLQCLTLVEDIATEVDAAGLVTGLVQIALILMILSLMVLILFISATAGVDPGPEVAAEAAAGLVVAAGQDPGLVEAAGADLGQDLAVRKDHALDLDLAPNRDLSLSQNPNLNLQKNRLKKIMKRIKHIVCVSAKTCFFNVKQQCSECSIVSDCIL